jgi:DNA repair protein RecO (recombination protein O)
MIYVISLFYIMNIQDIGIIVFKKHMQENAALISVFTKNHGIYTGFVKRLNKKNIHIYQTGNIVNFTWKARLEEHLGMADCELINSSSHFMNNKNQLYALNSLLSIIKASFKERIPYKYFFEALYNYISDKNRKFCFTEYIYLEKLILREIGYGLDLSSCAVTGTRKNLAYVSPKTGRAVSFSAGKQYHDKLLRLPYCLLTKSSPQEVIDIEDSAKLILYFLKRYVFGNYEPESRKIFVKQCIDNYL